MYSDIKFSQSKKIIRRRRSRQSSQSGGELQLENENLKKEIKELKNLILEAAAMDE